MALTPAAMAALIQDEIEARVSGLKRGSNDGESWENYTLDELYQLRRQYLGEVQDAALAATGGVSMSTILRTRLDVTDDGDC